MTNKVDLSGAEEVKAGWFKFENVGDGLKGTLLGKEFREGRDGFQDQMVYKIKSDGNIWNVAISMSKKGTIDRMNLRKNGDIVAIVFDALGEKVKGKNQAKFLKIYHYPNEVDEDYNPLTAGAEEVELPENEELPEM